jgi:hypothetical protein
VLLGIDHLVIAVTDPDAAAAVIEADLGLAVTGGGRHEGGGTWNRLAFLGDTYLELIGVFDRELVLASPANVVGRAALRLLDEGREGLATYALATGDVEGDVAQLRQTGSPIGAAVAGSRRRPDGEVIRWTCAFPDLGPEDPPFLIEHELQGTEWGVEARSSRASFRHPGGGAVRLAALSIRVGDPWMTAATYRRVLGITFDDAMRAEVGGQAIRLAGREAGAHPTVALAADPGTLMVDIVRFGIRWQRVARA